MELSLTLGTRDRRGRMIPILMWPALHLSITWTLDTGIESPWWIISLFTAPNILMRLRTGAGSVTQCDTVWHVTRGNRGQCHEPRDSLTSGHSRSQRKHGEWHPNEAWESDILVMRLDWSPRARACTRGQCQNYQMYICNIWRKKRSCVLRDAEGLMCPAICPE